MDDRIGSYVLRETATERPLTKAHLVESVINDEPITRCGRRLRDRKGTTLRYVDSGDLCESCAS